MTHAHIAAGHTCTYALAGRGEAGHHAVGHAHESAMSEPDDSAGDERHHDHHVADDGLLVGQRGVERIAELKWHAAGEL